MEAATEYDAIIIGSGQAGTPLASALAQAGRKTALIERVHVGGTCVNEGCTPTKTMVASARVAYLARRGADYGVRTGEITVDMGKVRERKRGIVNSFRSGSQERLEKTLGLDLIFGEASFTGPKSVQIKRNDGTVTDLTADYIFINTGTRAAQPVLPGFESISALDNFSIMELDTVPERLIVLGGGYIGLEFGQMFRRFGSKVTVIHSRPQLLAREDPDVAEEIEKILREDGIEFVLNTKPTRVAQRGTQIEVEVPTKDGPRQLWATHLLSSIGRIPNTEVLNLKAAGIAADQYGFIVTNNRLETNVAGVYALGDVKGGPAFTHISYDDFRIIRTNLLDGRKATTDDRLLPYTVFIDPQLGRVGMSETEARASDRKILVAKISMNQVARALEMDESRGFLKAIVDVENGQILGAAVVGIEGGEIMAMLEVAMMGKLQHTVLRDGIFAHPTLAESFNKLFADLKAIKSHEAENASSAA